MATTYESLNELLPVATVVHIVLGIMTLILVHNSKEKEWNERLASLMIAWLMIVRGCEYFFTTWIDFILEGDVQVDGYEDIFHSVLTYGQNAVQIIFLSMVTLLPLIYPYPLIQRNTVIKIFVAIIVSFTIIIVPLHIISEFTFGEGIWTISELTFIIWIPIYLRFLFGEMFYEEKGARNISTATCLLYTSPSPRDRG